MEICNKRNTTTIYINEKPVRIDSCMANLIHDLNLRGIKTLGCCCGHGRYNMSIVRTSSNGRIWDMMSGAEIMRKKRFYRKDKDGFYYIPETLERGGGSIC